MLKRFATALLGLVLMGSALSVAAAAPASAGERYTTPDYCITYTYRDVTTCIRLNWERQADGTGVRLEGLRGYTTDCGKLKDGGEAYRQVTPKFMRGDRTDYAYDFGNEPCSFYKDLSNAGFDSGSMDFFYNATSVVKFANDKRLNIGIRLWPDGQYALLFRQERDADRRAARQR